MNTHETMIEQIRRLNQQAQVKHEQRKQAALKRIRELREHSREKTPSHN